MLDIKFIRQNPEDVKEGLKKRNFDIDVGIIDQILEKDTLWRLSNQRIERLKAQQNLLSRKIPQLEDKEREEALIELKEIKAQIVRSFIKSTSKLKERDDLRFKLPNLPLDNVPAGGLDKYEVLDQWGEKTKFNFTPKDHLELAKALDWIDMERAANVSGTRFAYLKGNLVLIEFALIKLALDIAIKEGFVPLIPPVLIRPNFVEDALGYWDDEEGRKNLPYIVRDDRCPHCNHDLFVRVDNNGEYMSGKFFCIECSEEKLQEITEDRRLKCHNCAKATRLPYYYLIGTAEHAIAPMHGNEIFEEQNLPKRYVGFSTAFRREAGTYGKDTRGILRVHQFDKVELFSICHPEKSKEEHKFLVGLEGKLWQTLRIPYRVIQLAAGDMSRPAASTIDIETWMPGLGEYKEVSSASNTTDFQSRRLNIRYRKKDGSLRFVHLLNATGFAIGRTLIAILENYQQKDGSIKIPKALKKYL